MSKGPVNRGAVNELRVPAEFVIDDESPNEATLLSVAMMGWPNWS
jgi:hypothetical protein